MIQFYSITYLILSFIPDRKLVFVPIGQFQILFSIISLSTIKHVLKPTERFVLPIIVLELVSILNLVSILSIYDYDSCRSWYIVVHLPNLYNFRWLRANYMVYCFVSIDVSYFVSSNLSLLSSYAYKYKYLNKKLKISHLRRCILYCLK